MRQRQPPPAFRNSSTGDTTTSKPHASSWRPTRGGHDGITTVVPTTTELAQKAERLVVVEHERLGDERLDHLAAVGVPARRGDDGPAVVERTEREVEVVEPLVDQLDGAHRRAGEPGEVGVGGGVGAEAVAGQEHAAEREGVARALVGDAGGQARRPRSRAPRTRRCRAASRAWRSGWRKWVGTNVSPVDDAGVGGEDEVGQVGRGARGARPRRRPAAGWRRARPTARGPGRGRRAPRGASTG